jgi:transporter family protein
LRAFVFALFAAVCYGIAPLFGKVGLSGITPLSGLAARTIVTVCFVWGWFIASGNIRSIATISHQGWFFLGVEAFLATFAGDLAYYVAIKYGSIGPTALVISASPLITIWIGYMVLGEHLSLNKLLGAILIIAGVVLVGLNPN